MPEPVHQGVWDVRLSSESAKPSQLVTYLHIVVELESLLRYVHLAEAAAGL